MVNPATVKLGRNDWINAATDTLLGSGVDAVQITRLATRLGVSRGSFYWHFSDRAELLNAILAHWQSTNSAAISSALAEVTSLSEAILEFFSLWLNYHDFSAALEQAVRDWARLDDSVLHKVRTEDQLRITRISKCFERFGYEPNEALVRARVLYFAQIGYYAMHMEESMQDRLAMTAYYYTSFTGRKLNDKVASAFFERIRQGS